MTHLNKNELLAIAKALHEGINKGARVALHAEAMAVLISHVRYEVEKLVSARIEEYEQHRDQLSMGDFYERQAHQRVEDEIAREVCAPKLGSAAEVPSPADVSDTDRLPF